MLTWTQFATAEGVALLFGLTVIAVMHRPLFAVLSLICHTDVGARFWTAYSSIMVVLEPIFAVSVRPGGSDNPAEFLRGVILLSTIGLTSIIAIMGMAVRRSTKIEPPAPPAETASSPWQ